jgi:hypothetical protein
VSVLLRNIVKGDVVWEDGYVYEATEDPRRVEVPMRNGHACTMRGITGHWRGEVVEFFEALEAWGYGLKLERFSASEAAAIRGERT